MFLFCLFCAGYKREQNDGMVTRESRTKTRTGVPKITPQICAKGKLFLRNHNLEGSWGRLLLHWVQQWLSRIWTFNFLVTRTLINFLYFSALVRTLISTVPSTQTQCSLFPLYLRGGLQKEGCVVLLCEWRKRPPWTGWLCASWCHLTGLIQEISCGAGIIAVVVVVVGVEGLHRDAGMWFSCGVVGLGAWVILSAQLHRWLHGDVCVLREAVAAVGGRRRAVAYITQCLRLQLDYTVRARTETEGGKRR